MTHPHDEEAEDRAIARALDADGTDEIDEAAMNRATIDEYRRVLAQLPFEELAPPAVLEERVVEAALGRRPAAARSIAGSARRRRTARWVTLGAAVTAAAAVIAFMFATTGDGEPAPGGRVALAGAGREDRGVLSAEGVRRAPLIGKNDGQVGDVALAPDGRGLLQNLNLDPLLAQLGDRTGVPGVWLGTDGKVVPIGPLDMTSGDFALDVTGDVDAVKTVALTLEDPGQRPQTQAAQDWVASAQFDTP
jgi:Anti-sigma-K factor rskA